MKIFIRALLLCLVLCNSVWAATDQQSFIGGGIGFQVLSRDGSGTGFYLQGQGGYSFASSVALGLHAGYSNIGQVGIDVLDFGAFTQLTEPESGFYFKLFIDGVRASTDGGGRRNGVDGDQLGFAPGLGAGLLIPSVGDLHFVPEIAYRVGFFEKKVNLIAGTVNVVWDF